MCFFSCPGSSRSPLMDCYLWSTGSLNTYLLVSQHPPFYCSHSVLSYAPIFIPLFFFPIILFYFNSLGAYDKGCALQAVFSHLHLILNRCCYIRFMANAFAHLIAFLQAIFSSRPNIYFILIFSFTFPFPMCIIRLTHP